MNYQGMLCTKEGVMCIRRYIDARSYHKILRGKTCKDMSVPASRGLVIDLTCWLCSEDN